MCSSTLEATKLMIPVQSPHYLQQNLLKKSLVELHGTLEA